MTTVMATQLRPAHISTDDFGRMIEAGIAQRLGRVELREGRIYEMNSEYTPHARVKTRLAQVIGNCLKNAGQTAEPIVEVSLKLNDVTAVTPDIIISDGDTSDNFATLACTRLVIEVSFTTLSDDLGWKKTAYAAAGIPEYWVVDGKAQCVHQYSQPAQSEYQAVRTVRFGEPLASITIPGLDLGIVKFA